MRVGRASLFGVAAALTLCACFHDFDEPFSGSGASSTGGESTGGTNAGGANTGGDGDGNRGGGSSSDGGGGSTSDGGAPPELCVEGTVCAPTVPAGWTGPLAISHGVPGSVAACDDVVADLESGAISAPNATCSLCSCGAASGAVCGPPVVELYDDRQCNGTPAATVTVTSTCQPVSGVSSNDVGLLGLTIAIADPGSCTPNGGGVVNVPSASFAESNRLCTLAPAAGTCGGTCVSPLASPYEPSVCIAQHADVECPSVYTDRTVLFGDMDDTRGCSACACDDPMNVSCAGSAVAYESAGCINSSDGVNFNENCKDAAQGVASIRIGEAVHVNNNGSCLKSGGMPTGSATGADPWTVCCIP